MRAMIEQSRRWAWYLVAWITLSSGACVHTNGSSSTLPLLSLDEPPQSPNTARCSTIDSVYQSYIAASDTADKTRIQLTLIRSFPHDAKSFVEIFGYWTQPDGSFASGCLYKDSQRYILEPLQSVPRQNYDEYLGMLIGASVGQQWQGDGVNYLQHLVRNELELHPESMLQHIEALGRTEALAFWAFYFDNPVVPEFPRFLIESYSENYPQAMHTLEEAQKGAELNR
ncbi:MAG: hypothetical protein ABI432_04945 [Flavobacteriales bacterium]